MKQHKILAIETSCDETSMAIIENGHTCLALTVLTQMATHAQFGGVVPEIASRMHTENITLVLADVLAQAKIKPQEIDAIAVTSSPGLLGSLLVGVETAKTLSYIWQKPLIAVNHLMGHIYANNLDQQMVFPLLALIVSGGHTQLMIMQDDYQYEIIGQTQDDAIGEAFDKVARILDLPYPGGPNIEQLASTGQPSYKLAIANCTGPYDFSYSGLKSQVVNLVHNEKQKSLTINKADLACSFQRAAIEQVIKQVKKAIIDYQIQNMIVAGGVAANKLLRAEITALATEKQVNLLIPPLKYCTDNAAMIGAAAYPLYLKKDFADLSLNADSQGNI